MKKRSDTRQTTMRLASARKEYGFSLIAVTAILIISSLWASAMMGAMLPTYEKLVSMKVQSLARNAAEAGLDYAIGQLNTAYQAPYTASNIDATTIGTTKTTVLPSNLTVNTGANVSVTVYNEMPPSTAIVYDPNIANLVNQNLISNPFRRVEAQATVGGIMKKIRVIVAPMISNPPYVGFAAFGKSSVNCVGPSGFDSYNLPEGDPAKNNSYINGNGFYNIYANVGTNGSMIYNGDQAHPVTIGGSLYQTPALNQNSAVQNTSRQNLVSQFNGIPGQQYPWISIYDNVYSNTDTSGYWPRGAYPNNMNSWNNVYGWSNPGPTDPNNTSQPGPNGQVSPYGTYNQTVVQPAPSSPVGAYNLGNVRLSNSAQLIFKDGTAPPGGPIGTVSSGTVYLPPGNYVMNGLTMTNTSNIQVQTSTPVKIYIEGVSSGASTAISVAKNCAVNMNSNSQAKNLIIYYNGSKAINLSGNEKGVLYAPNANISVGTGQNQPANFYGALVGDSVNCNGGHQNTRGAYIHFDASLRSSSSYSSGQNNIQWVQISGLKAVSWQEL